MLILYRLSITTKLALGVIAVALVWLLLPNDGFARQCSHVRGRPGIHSLVEILKLRNGIYGADVSYYQGIVDWKRARATGVRFAFAKATEGNAHVDHCFALNWANMKDAGVIRGAYHFFHGHSSGATQAHNFIRAVKDHHTATDLPPVVDVEYTTGVVATPRSTYIKNLKQWLITVEQAFAIKPMIYTNYYFWHSYMKDSKEFDGYPLWLASFNIHRPKLLHPWSSYHFWQFTQSGSITGINTVVDMNLYNGSMESLMKFLRED